MELKSGISVVIPVYNSQGTLVDLTERICVTLSTLGVEFEVILVNDCSRDASWEKIKALTGQHSWARGINLMRNYGQHNALLCGIRAAGYSITVTIDDDLQNPPEEIPNLLEKLAKGFDVVYGTPQQEQHGVFRNLASIMTKLALQDAMGVEIARQVSAFRTFRTNLRDAFMHYQSSYVSIDVLLTWGTTRFSSIPVRHEKRQVGVSNYTLRKLIIHSLNMVTGFSVLPLQVASLVGFVFTMFGFLVLVYILSRYVMEGGSVAGFPFLASIISIFSGAQLFSLGIIGEYLARMYFRTIGKPPYIIRS